MSTQGYDPYTVYRAEIGHYVRHRLTHAPNAMKIPAVGLDLFVVRDFLSKKECDQLIALIDKDRVPSGLLSPSGDPEFRTSDSCNLRVADPIVVQVQGKIDALMGIDGRHGETIQGQRYGPGQQFKEHHDFFYQTEAYWPDQERTGGQRTWTAMVFLNEPEAGGQTWFTKANVRVTPRTGNLLAWNNMDEHGQPNPYSLHTGMPVGAGVKYIITKWYRERFWAWQADMPAPARPY